MAKFRLCFYWKKTSFLISPPFFGSGTNNPKRSKGGHHFRPYRGRYSQEVISFLQNSRWERWLFSPQDCCLNTRFIAMLEKKKKAQADIRSMQKPRTTADNFTKTSRKPFYNLEWCTRLISLWRSFWRNPMRGLLRPGHHNHLHQNCPNHNHPVQNHLQKNIHDRHQDHPLNNAYHNWLSSSPALEENIDANDFWLGTEGNRRGSRGS